MSWEDGGGVLNGAPGAGANQPPTLTTVRTVPGCPPHVFHAPAIVFPAVLAHGFAGSFLFGFNALCLRFQCLTPLLV